MVWRNREWIDWWCGGIEWNNWGWCGGIEWIDWWCGGIEWIDWWCGGIEWIDWLVWRNRVE